MSEGYTIILDGDIPVFTAAMHAETVYEWDDDLFSLVGDLSKARDHFDAFLAEVSESINPDRVIVALSDSENFRHDVLPSYKHNRTVSRRPIIRQQVKDYVISEYETVVMPRLEGDDVLGILSTSGRFKHPVAMTIDKDLRTIPGLSLNWNAARKAMDSGVISEYRQALFDISKEQADYFHLLQTLAGDTTDGYSGCPGIGMQTADLILSDDPHRVTYKEYIVSRGKRKGERAFKKEKVYGDYTPWKTVLSYFGAESLTESDALKQARVARILTSDLWDAANQEVILWTP